MRPRTACSASTGRLWPTPSPTDRARCTSPRCSTTATRAPASVLCTTARVSTECSRSALTAISTTGAAMCRSAPSTPRAGSASPTGGTRNSPRRSPSIATTRRAIWWTRRSRSSGSYPDLAISRRRVAAGLVQGGDRFLHGLERYPLEGGDVPARLFDRRRQPADPGVLPDDDQGGRVRRQRARQVTDVGLAEQVKSRISEALVDRDDLLVGDLGDARDPVRVLVDNGHVDQPYEAARLQVDERRGEIRAELVLVEGDDGDVDRPDRLRVQYVGHGGDSARFSEG